MNESQYNTVQNSTLHALQDDLILSVIEQLKTQVVNCTKINQDNKQVNELLTAELERNVADTNNANSQRGTGSGQKSRCHECGVQGHFRKECPKLRNNNNHGNQGGRNNAPTRVYAVGRAGADPDANVVTGNEYDQNRTNLSKTKQKREA
nr:hypothetical protein [Tanacetum cinerariifolium]